MALPEHPAKGDERNHEQRPYWALHFGIRSFFL